MILQRRSAYRYNPCFASHSWMSPATCRLFLSIISMCELPRMPTFGRSTISTLPPAFEISPTKSTPFFLICGQRESSAMLSHPRATRLGNSHSPDLRGPSAPSHALHQRAQARAHLLRRQPDAPAVPGEHPLETVIGELRERAPLLAPGIPARVAKREQVLALAAPGERIAGEEIGFLEQVDHAAFRVARDGDRKQLLADLRGLTAPQQIGRVRRGATIVLVNPDARIEMLRVATGVGDVVLMREQDIVHSAEIFQLLNELLDVSRRVDEQVAFGAPHEVGVRAESGFRVVAAAVDARRKLLRKKIGRLRPMTPGADRGGRADEHRAPCGALFILARGLPCENGFPFAVNDEAGRGLARGAAVDAAAVDVPVTRRRGRIAFEELCHVEILRVRASIRNF